VGHKIDETIEEITKHFSCPKDFKCCKSGFENLCKATDIGLRSFLECLEENPLDCPFAVSFGFSYFCQCPLRIYLKRELGK